MQAGSFTPATPTGWVARPGGTEPTTAADVLVGMPLDGTLLADAEIDAADGDSDVFAELLTLVLASPADVHPVTSRATASIANTKAGRPDAGPLTVLINRHHSSTATVAVPTGRTGIAHPVTPTCTID